MSFSIDYKLTGPGWAECTIADGEKSCTVTASYLRDAFGDLVLSAVALLHWYDELSFSFREEPGEFRWTFVYKFKDNNFELKIWDWFYSDSVAVTDPRSSLLFQTVVSPETFGTAVLAAGKNLLAQHGEAGYREKWVEHPFPSESMNELQRLLERSPA